MRRDVAQRDHMLRICYSDTGAEQRWKLCGQLAGAWVNELEACWRYAQKAAPRNTVVLDLSEITFVDEAGERLLSHMRSAGARFIGAGVDTKDLLDNLESTNNKPLRRLIGGNR
jgi:hypothetical protein